jgi:stearoyl-CoA desaturase (delta-9 desaturase)
VNSRFHKHFNLAVVVGPIVGLVVTVFVLWNQLVSWTDLLVLAIMYALAGFGLTVGYHRLLSHRSFETYPSIRIMFAVLGSMAGQGPPVVWVADHRKHHTFADEDGDPHSPHVHEKGMRPALRGLWHSYMGWLFDLKRRSEPLRYAPDLVRDPAIRRVSANFFVILALGLLLPFLMGLALTGALAGALTAMAWGGPVRLFLGYHATFTVNSLGHYWGSRPFETGDGSRNLVWFALPSLGDGWHNNHHAFPRSARHGLRWWQIDPSGLLISGMERLGLAWDSVTVSPERQERKRILATPPQPPQPEQPARPRSTAGVR